MMINHFKDMNLSNKLAEKNIFLFGFYFIDDYKLIFLDKIIKIANTTYLYNLKSSHSLSKQDNNALLYKQKEFINITNNTHIKTKINMENFYTKNINQEIAYILTKIKKLELQKISFTQISIIYPDIPEYETIILKQCRKMNIPIYGNIENKLADTINGSFLISLINFITSNSFSIELKTLLKNPLLKYVKIKSKIVPLWPDILYKILDILLENTSIDMLFENWKEKKQLLLEDLQNLMKNKSILISDFNDQIMALDAIITWRENILTTKTYKQTIKLLKSFANLINLKNNDKNYKLLLNLFLQYYESLSLTEFSLKNLLEELKIFLKTYNNTQSIKSKNGIYLLKKETAIGALNDYIFICGLTDKYWYSRHKFENIIPANFFKLTKIDEKEYLMLLMKQAKQQLFLSYSTQNTQATYLLFSLKLANTFTPISDIDNKPQNMPSETKIINDIPTLLSQEKKALNQPFNTNNSNIKKQALFKTEILEAQKQKWDQQGFTVTELETYLKCPKLFWYKYVLKEKVIEKTFDDIDPRIWGNIIHQLLYEVYSYNKITNKPLQFIISKDKFYEIRNKIVSNLAKSNHLWKINIDKIQYNLLKNLTSEWQKINYNLVPAYLEQKFNNLKIEGKNQSIIIKGQIDAIFYDKNKKQYIIIDYKTGSKIPSVSNMKKFESLQLPIYILAGKKILLENQFVGAGYLKLKNLDNPELKINIINKQISNISDLGLTKRNKPLEFQEKFQKELSCFLIDLKNQIMSYEFLYSNNIKNKISKDICSMCDFKYYCKEALL